MSGGLTPVSIFEYLNRYVLGQEDVLRRIAVSLYKHIQGVGQSNIILIGNSGTGKTTIMKAIRRLFADYPDLARHRTMAIMNANTLVDEEGEVHTARVFKTLELEVERLLGENCTPEELSEYMTHATVCFDEVDKISAKIAGKSNVTGVAVQQAMLTVLEGEILQYETVLTGGGKNRTVKIPVDTSKMLFIAGGAFEELYDQVYSLMENRKDERRLKEEQRWDKDAGRLRRIVVFRLSEVLKLTDLFAFGMMPQFISRFGAVAILEDLDIGILRRILLEALDSPFVLSREYFRSFGIDLDMTGEAIEKIAVHAEKNARIGARALREVFGRIIARFEFDPLGCGRLEPSGGGSRLNLEKADVDAAIAVS